jgi:hypothetical protein
MGDAVYYIPIFTTVLSLAFTGVVLHRWRLRRSSHLLWWAGGIFVFGVGTFMEGYTALFGWHPAIFRAWYISGALLGGAPLAQGTAFLLLPRKTAFRLAVALVVYVAVASVFVLLTPLDASLADDHKLAGDVIEWSWVRGFSPLVNTYAFLMLVGGAIYSAVHYRRSGNEPDRVVGNILIAVGAVLPGIGGSFTRFGYTEVLYVTECVGLITIYAGYRFNIRNRPAASSPVATAPRTALLPAAWHHESEPEQR